MLFPSKVHPGVETTRLAIDVSDPDRFIVRWVGATRTQDEQADDDALLELLGPHRGSPLLVEHAHGSFQRPSLRGHRLVGDGEMSTEDPRDVAGRAWTTRFVPQRLTERDTSLIVEAADLAAGLNLDTELESLPGGAVRMRHRLINAGTTAYLLEGLEVAVALPADLVEILDFTGRHERERTPRRHGIEDGLWLQESRRGKPAFGSGGLLVAGAEGFGFATGEVVSVAVATSGNSVVGVQRDEANETTLVAGELLLPGEVVLLPQCHYTTPWVVVAASREGLDGAAHALHSWQRSLDAHPPQQPITLNVWEAVYFDHDEERLLQLADRAAQVGVERFVLDDGWFLGRRDDTAGLGDWWVDPDVWPRGLSVLIDRVRDLGMEFGLWFEPEMVNPGSRLYRSHPDWILSAGDRVPLLHRHQLVLDLTREDAWTYVRDRVHAVLSENAVDYVKWDHNRDLLEAGSAAHGGAPAVQAQNQAYYALLDDLRARHPDIAWESCASGGGRIDLGAVERVQRFWTSDMTDAQSRQHIQRWTEQLVAPEYLGAHISAPRSHQTGRVLSLDFRAATAFFLAFGIEWDLTQASQTELDELGTWIELHKLYRPLLHTGRVFRLDPTDEAVLVHGVIAPDRSAALLCHVQLEESTDNRGCTIRLSQLEEDTAYDLRWIGPTRLDATSKSPPLPEYGPTRGARAKGRHLADIGMWIPRRPPGTAQLIALES